MSSRYIHILPSLPALPVNTRTALALSTLGRRTGMCRQPEAKWHLKSPPTPLRAASFTLLPTMPQVGPTPGTRHHATSSPRPAAALVVLTHDPQTPEPPMAKPWLAHIVPRPAAALHSHSAQSMGIRHRLHRCCMVDQAGISLPSLRTWKMLRTIQTWSILSVKWTQSRRFLWI